MQRSKKVGFAASITLVAVIGVTLLAGGRIVNASCGNVGVCWHLVASPNVGNGTNILNSVYAVSSKSIWAVGTYLNGSNAAQTLVEQGTPDGNGGYSWSVISSPNPGTNGNQLNGVAFARNDLNATDVWAVGSATGGTAAGVLIVRYQNGVWSRYSTDSLGIEGNLNGISGSRSDDYWAVGSYPYNSHDYPLALHWDGTRWTNTGTVNEPYTYTYLTSVSAVDSQTAWAAGFYLDDSGYYHPFMIRWDGTQWHDDTANLPSNAAGTILTGVSFNSGSIGWAVGTDANNQSIAFYHDSGGWHENDPYPGHHDGKLAGVDFIANNSAWAAGSVPNSDPISDYWNGTQWTHYSPESPGSYGGIFHSVSGVSNTDVWAVGTFLNGHQQSTLIEHYN